MSENTANEHCYGEFW